ncbi:MAG: sodium:proton antiporter [Bacteroidetes bacterium]|nr:sodium:proton antiporter [Bacteroidota bacterium]
MESGIWSLVPPLVVVLLGILTRRSLESLLIGCMVGALMIDWRQFPGNFLSLLSETMANDSLIWVILVCSIYGMLIQLIVASGSAIAFGSFLLRYIKTRKSALLSTWFTGILVFPDDYLSALSTGVSMRNITDRFSVSRPLLAYLVNATAAPVCAIIPLSTWGVFTAKLLEDNQMFPAGQGILGFAFLVPFNFYAIFALLISFGVALGWVPLFKKMKEMENIVVIEPAEKILANSPKSKAGPVDFILPMFILVGGTIILKGDALQGAALAFVFTLAWYSAKNILPYSILSNQALEGFKEMLLPLAILSLSFLLKSIGDKMGLTPFVIAEVKNHFPAFILPAGIFLMLSFISYTTCSSWGLYTVALPIVIPLSAAMNINPYLMVGAVLSAGVFGSNASFFSDCTILTSSSTECTTSDHSFSQLPYALLALSFAALLYLAGYWLF